MHMTVVYVLIPPPYEHFCSEIQLLSQDCGGNQLVMSSVRSLLKFRSFQEPLLVNRCFCSFWRRLHLTHTASFKVCLLGLCRCHGEDVFFDEMTTRCCYNDNHKTSLGLKWSLAFTSVVWLLVCLLIIGRLLSGSQWAFLKRSGAGSTSLRRWRFWTPTPWGWSSDRLATSCAAPSPTPSPWWVSGPRVGC